MQTTLPPWGMDSRHFIANLSDHHLPCSVAVAVPGLHCVEGAELASPTAAVKLTEQVMSKVAGGDSFMPRPLRGAG